MKDAEYQSNIVMLKNADTLVLYTDGVTEAFNKNDEEYDDKRLTISLRQAVGLDAGKLIDKIISDVRQFTNGVEQSDDITCMALRYLK